MAGRKKQKGKKPNPFVKGGGAGKKSAMPPAQLGDMSSVVPTGAMRGKATRGMPFGK